MTKPATNVGRSLHAAAIPASRNVPRERTFAFLCLQPSFGDHGSRVFIGCGVATRPSAAPGASVQAPASRGSLGFRSAGVVAAPPPLLTGGAAAAAAALSGDPSPAALLSPPCA